MIDIVAALIIAAVVGFIVLRLSGGGGDKGDKQAAWYKSAAPYPRAYKTNATVASLPQQEAPASGAGDSVGDCKFLLTMKHQLQRDYTLLIDRSGSMSSGTRWREAEAAVKQLAPYVCRFDPDGVSVIFFDHEIAKAGNVTTAAEVEDAFRQFRPRGSTNLALGLHTAFDEHFKGSRGASTILVVTDGAPNSRSEVERVIKRAAGSLELDAELSVSFIQIGNDAGATKYLKYLDDDLSDAKFDIVDTLTAKETKSISFNELIARSIFD